MNTRPSEEVLATTGPARFIPYEVPLRPGITARLVLPIDLTAGEAERLCGVITALAFGDGFIPVPDKTGEKK